MARALIVGCGCRGRELAAALIAEGHAVRGTTRREAAREAIEAAGAEAAIADPDRLGTVTEWLDGVSAVIWLMGTAGGDQAAVEAVHGPRLESLLEAIVDTPVRGFVYEAAGSVEPALLERGAHAVHRASARFRIPVELIERDPRDRPGWLEAARHAFEQVLQR